MQSTNRMRLARGPEQLQEVLSIFEEINNLCDLSKLLIFATKLRDALKTCKMDMIRVPVISQIAQKFDGN